MKKRRNNNSIKTSLIVVLCVIATFLVLYFAITLLSDNQKENENQDNNYSKNNEAIEIIDGDTFRTVDGEIVRLLCVDTPEKGEEGYDEATTFLGSRLFYSDITLEGNETDKYGRSLRWVYVDDDVLVNKEIIDLGYGTLFEYENEDCGRVK